VVSAAAFHRESDAAEAMTMNGDAADGAESSSKAQLEALASSSSFGVTVSFQTYPRKRKHGPAGGQFFSVATVNTNPPQVNNFLSPKAFQRQMRASL